MDQIDQIAHHAAEIARIMSVTAPDGASIQGFQFRVDEEGEPFAIWGTARVGPNLTHIRPGVFDGWREKQLSLAG